MVTKNKKIGFILIYFLIALTLGLQAAIPNPPFQSLFDLQKVEVEGNFLNSHVNCAYQDSRGFMWFGTENGLCRYDGTDILKFTTVNSDLPYNSIYRIMEDDQGFLWVFNNNNVSKELGNARFINVNNLKTAREEEIFSYSLPEGVRVREGKNQVLYLVDDQAEIRFKYEDGEIKKLEYDDRPVEEVSKKEVFQRFLKCAHLGIRNISFLNTNDTDNYSLILVDVDGEGKMHTISFELYENGTRHGAFFRELTAEGNLVPVGAKSGPKTITASRHSTIYYNPKSKNIWSKDYTQLKVANLEKDLYFNFKEYFPKLAEVEVINIEFYNDIVWLCTSTGLYKAIKRQFLFDQHLNKKDVSEKMYSCRSIYTEDNENIMIFTNDLVEVSEDKTKVIVDKYSPPFIEKIGDTLWTGHYGIQKIVNNEIVETIPIASYQYGIWSVQKDPNSDLYWVGLGKGLSYWTKDMDSIRHYQHLNKYQSLDDSEVFDIKILSNGNALIATNLGIYECSFEKGVLHHYWEGGKGKYYLPLNEYYYIYLDEDDDNIVWLASNGGGLVKWDKQNGEHDRFSIEDGFTSSIICAIYEDEFNQLWLPSYYGLMKFDKETNEVTTFTVEDGLSHNEFNRGSHFESFDGKLYFGGLNGVNSFYPKDLQEASKTENAPLYLIGLDHFDERKDTHLNKLTSFNKDSIIKILPSEGYVNISFASLDYKNTKTQLYTYEIESINGTKTYTTKDHEIRVSGLSYGNHSIRIKGKKEFSEELVLAIEVIKPWYVQWQIPIFMFLGCVLILMVYSVFVYRNRRFIRRSEELEHLVKKQTSELQKDKEIIEKQARELVELDKVKSRFFANVSHELRTPITLIQGPIQSILNQGGLTNRNEDLLRKVKSNTQNLMELVNELLDLTKIEAGNLTLDETEVVFSQIVLQKFSSFQSLAELQNIQFLLKNNIDNSLTIKVDAKKLDKILNNLLTNAFKFTASGGEIQFIIDDMGDKIRIQVKDNGRGIPAEDIPYIFNRFYQSSKNKKAEGGLGIGLALSNEFVKLFNGQLWVESEEDKGTTFFVQFPKKVVLSQESEKVLGTLVTAEEIQKIVKKKILSSSCKPSILLVEDHVDLQEYIETVLNPHYRIIKAGNGKEALVWLENNPKPSLIISDLMMPIMDGYELLENLKKNNHLFQIPCIMLTARADIKDRLKALRIGVDDYLTKPFDEEELLVRIENLLFNSKNRKEFIDVLSKEEESPLSLKDQEWLTSLENITLQEINHHSFSIDYLAERLSINRDKLFKKVKLLTGLTPNQYVRIIRLKLAKDLLEKEPGIRVKDVALKVGFQKTEYFSKLYKDYYGKSPSEFISK